MKMRSKEEAHPLQRRQFLRLWFICIHRNNNLYHSKHLWVILPALIFYNPAPQIFLQSCGTLIYDIYWLLALLFCLTHSVCLCFVTPTFFFVPILFNFLVLIWFLLLICFSCFNFFDSLCYLGFFSCLDSFIHQAYLAAA